jgi:hypothetical protein
VRDSRIFVAVHHRCLSEAETAVRDSRIFMAVLGARQLGVRVGQRRAAAASTSAESTEASEPKIETA